MFTLFIIRAEWMDEFKMTNTRGIDVIQYAVELVQGVGFEDEREQS